MRAPRFWQSNNLVSMLLLPASWLYDLARRLRLLFARPLTLPVPVICIGNLTAGGAGKTPAALHIGRKLKERNVPTFFLTRGYGGTQKGPLLIDPRKHTAQEVGDEPLLLAQLLPTIVAKDRASGARLAVAQGAKAIVMDDGFQNPSVSKTLSFLIIDGRQQLGNGRLIPAGPLREPAPAGFARAQAVIVINPSANMRLPGDKPVLHVKTIIKNPQHMAGKPLLAFCGIATPQKFFISLAECGAHLVDTASFSDHHRYRDSELTELVHRARAKNALLVTTAKDAVRLPRGFRDQVIVAELALAFGDEAALDKLLDFALRAG